MKTYSLISYSISLMIFAGVVHAQTVTPITPVSPTSNNKAVADQENQSVVYPIESVSLSWYDAQRGRNVPVKIYYPAVSQGAFPLILFSHGLGRSKDDYAYLGAYWASHGYVSVHVQHIGSDDALRKGTLQPMKQLKKAYDNADTMRQRPADLLFALSQLETLRDAGDALARRIDFKRIGASGNDLGAETALTLGGQVLGNGLTYSNPRIKAVIAMSPPVIPGQVPLDVAFGSIHSPCLYIAGTEDNGKVGTTTAAQRRLPFDYSSGAADQYLMTLEGGDHMVYAGHLRSWNAEKDAKYQNCIMLGSLAFWDAYLKEKPAARQNMQSGQVRFNLGSLARVETKLSTSNAPSLAGK